MAQAKKKKKKLRLKKSVRYSLYFAVLCAGYFIVYSTLFTHAYQNTPQDPANSQQAADASRNADNSPVEPGEVQGPSQPASGSQKYTTYPDTGEKVATVLIDAGHGGFDGGNANADGDIEKNINLKMSQLVAQKLQELNPQLNVLTIRNDDEITWADNEWDDLNYRMEQQEATGSDYFVSLHCNSLEDPSVRGFEFFINSGDDATAGMTDLMRQYLQNLDGWIPYHSTQQDARLQLVYMSRIHSILIEMGFMSNAEDMAILKDENKMNESAAAIAAAISDYIMQHPDQTDPSTIGPRVSA